ncbi:MAG: hypothetical protein D4R92_03870 [Actinobacteria bacterium]|nr:MAG: hypothetical protein D4R92_03870 [Actinomycetota bacterium]
MRSGLRADDEVCLAYLQLRDRVIDLLEDLDQVDGEKLVPACPAWNVRKLVSHIVGVPEDILKGRMTGVTTDPWTQAQVDRHEHDSIDRLREILTSQRETFDSVLPKIPSPINSQFVFDAVTHEHDLREAIDKPGAQDSLAVKVACAWLFSHDQYSDEFIEQIQVLEISEFQKMRALSGRLSIEQMNAIALPGLAIANSLEGSPLKTPN